MSEIGYKRLSGRVALVTGAGRMRGIGRATALRLAAEGAAVIVSALARNPQNDPIHERDAEWKGAESVVAEIEALGGKAISIDCDVTDRAQVERLFQRAERELGTPDAIVNNAGTPGGAGRAPLIDLDDALWHRAFDINLHGTYYVCKAAAAAMREKNKPGAIVNISSLAGRVALEGYGGYCASKFAVIGLSQQLALELARYGIRVNCLCPGLVDTDMMAGTFMRTADRSGRTDADGVRNAVIGTIPLRRPGLPEEQAAAIAFMLGPDAAYMTGQSINLNGGARLD